MRTGLDMDGVVYPWHDEMYRYFQENKGYTGTIYDFWLKDKAIITEYYTTIPFLYNSTTPREDVLNYVPKIAELGEVYYITARPPEMWQVTKKFFDYYDLPFKENVFFEKNKANIVRLLRLDYFLDDMPYHVDSLKGITNVYLFNSIHNLNQRAGYKTVASMKEFYEIIAERK